LTGRRWYFETLVMKPHRFDVPVPPGRGDRLFRALLKICMLPPSFSKILHIAAK